jgi:hypothetical protein
VATEHSRNAALSRRMNRFFRRAGKAPDNVATQYASKFITGPDGLRWRQGPRYAVSVSSADTDWVLERTRLIVDTLVLPDHRPGDFHPLLLASSTQAPLDDPMAVDRERRRNYTETHLGIHCSDLAALGRRILAAEPLLRRGIVHLIPNYANRWTTYNDFTKATQSGPSPHDLASTFVAADRQFVDVGPTPAQNWAVRRLLTTDVPYAEGVAPIEFDETLRTRWRGFEEYRRRLRSAYGDPARVAGLLTDAAAVLRTVFGERVRNVRATLVTVDHGAFRNSYLPSRSTGDLWERIAEPLVFEPYLPTTDFAWILER